MQIFSGGMRDYLNEECQFRIVALSVPDSSLPYFTVSCERCALHFVIKNSSE